MPAEPEQILSFWFSDALDSPEAAKAQGKFWFGRSDAFDEEIRKRFGDLPERAARGEFEAWRDEPRSALALVLLLDQFPRNLFRDSARAFEFDAKACEVALGAIAARFDQKVHPIEAVFLYLPLEHAEDLELQNRSVGLFEKLCERAPDSMKSQFEEFADYARRHRDVIQRFGRFPHRNAVLGRKSTSEESDYLASGGERFGESKNEKNDSMEKVEFRRATLQDVSAILRIQSANYVANVPVEEQGDGFLSAEFTAQQVAEMASDLGIVVASDSESVLGYLCGFRCDFNHGSPVLAKMLETFDSVQFEGRALSSYRVFIYGPVCIDRAHRRRGLLRGLYEALKKEVAGRFEVGVAFVARNNPHSLQAHVAGLGMAEVGEFEVKENVYVTLAFKVN
ncbi:MAG TPA: DUF924 family protein [Candidatus Binatia bacterium]|nr:DUF924 family protein [Candidatus Binatia bacterium]